MSKKRAAAIADGTHKPKPRKPMKRTCITASEFRKMAMAKAGKSERAKAKAKAWKAFSEWIRLRDAGPDGRVQCITCPRHDHWRGMDAGHYITRAKESTLFDERNVSCQCKGCNRFQGGKFYEHGIAVDRKFGPGTREALERKAGRFCKRTVNDYLFLADTYRKRVELIKANEPARYERPI